MIKLQLGQLFNWCVVTKEEDTQRKEGKYLELLRNVDQCSVLGQDCRHLEFVSATDLEVIVVVCWGDLNSS